MNKRFCSNKDCGVELNTDEPVSIRQVAGMLFPLCDECAGNWEIMREFERDILLRIKEEVERNKKTDIPWKRYPLKTWSICGMNHYHVNGEKFLFVSMTKNNKCIVSEGKDSKELWNDLRIKAIALEDKV